MTLISIITLLVSIMLLIALFLHKKALNNDFVFFCLFGKHLNNKEKLKEREKALFLVAVCNFVFILLNLLCLIFK